MNNLAKQTFTKCKVRMSFLKKREIAFENFPSILLAYLSNFVASYIESVILCNSGDNLFLLGLIVNNGQFLFSLVHKLLAEERIPPSDYNSS
jgi:hypothetical protein